MVRFHNRITISKLIKTHKPKWTKFCIVYKLLQQEKQNHSQKHFDIDDRCLQKHDQTTEHF